MLSKRRKVRCSSSYHVIDIFCRYCYSCHVYVDHFLLSIQVIDVPLDGKRGDVGRDSRVHRRRKGLFAGCFLTYCREQSECKRPKYYTQ